MEDSIRNGETIREGWGTFSERETRPNEECDKRGEEFFPEDDWAMPERQAEDKRRAEAMASQRKMRYPGPAFGTNPRWNNAETNERGQSETDGRWERRNYTNWNYQSEGRRETETQDKIGEVDTSETI